MRENPWHLRRPHTEHYQWFRNLVELHELTIHWVNEIQSDRPSHFLPRGLSKEVTENLWMLDSISKMKLEDLLDDTQPHEMLSRLEYTIWAVQAWTLRNLLNQTQDLNRQSLDTVLDQISWRMGKICSETRWSPLIKKGYKTPLKSILLALNDSPFFGYPHSGGYLIKRAVSDELTLELRYCPHQNPFLETKQVEDRLCQLHTQWMRGFAYALNQQAIVEYQTHSPRCTQRWLLA